MSLWKPRLPDSSQLISNLRQDLAFSFRQLHKHPLSAALTIATLAIGTGATTAIFSLIYGVVLRPLPFEDSENLVVVARAMTGQSVDSDTTAVKLRFIQEHQRGLEHIAATVGGRWVMLRDTDRTERVYQERVTAEFFRVLNVDLTSGRDFLPDADRPGAAPSAVISEAFRRRRFADRSPLGEKLLLEGVSYTVIGVAPPSFGSVLSADLWTNFDVDNDPLAGGQNLRVLGRIGKHHSFDKAEADMQLVASRMAAELPNLVASNETLELVRLRDDIAADSRFGLMILFLAATLVLLIACANVANLLLARMAARRHEMAVRAALGSNRRRLVGQLMTESFVMACLGGIGGVILAQGLIWATVDLQLVDLPRLDEISIDWGALAFAFAIAALATALFGLFPAIHSSRMDLQSVLRDATRGNSGGKNWAGQGVVVLELALCLVLLVGAVLLVRSLANLWQVDPGFALERVTSFQTKLEGPRYSTPDQVARFADRVSETLDQGGGSTTAACLCRPLGGIVKLPLHSVDGNPRPENRYLGTVHWMPITSGFFDTMGIPLVAGRAFNGSDHENGQPVAIVNEAFAQKYFGTLDVVGKRLFLGWDIVGPAYVEDWREIVGVVRDFRESEIRSAPNGAVMIPIAQIHPPALAITLKHPITFLADTGNRTADLRSVQSALNAVDASLSIEELRGLWSLADDSLQEERFQTALLVGFALVASILVAIGIFGVASNSVARRRQEIGIRMALGATRLEVLQWVLRGSLRLALIGIAIGIPGALAVIRVLQSLLFGIEMQDWWILLAAPAVLGALTLVASFVPARSAAKTNIVNVLGFR